MACSKKKHTELLTSLLEVMQDEALTDLQLHLADGDVVTSRSVLAAMSPVFRRMLTDPMREREEGEITLAHVTLASWNVVVSFYFTEEELVTADNVEDIADIAHQYDMKSLEEHCSKVLCERSTIENCFTMLEIATKYGFADSVKRIICFIGKKFEAVSSMAEFCSLPQNQLVDLLGCSLFVVSEDSVAKAVLSWLEQNRVDEDTVAQLFVLVKLYNVSVDCLCTQILYNPRVVACSALKTRVANEVRRRCATSVSSTKIHERLPASSSNTVVLGSDGQRMHMFGSSELMEKWEKLPSSKSGDAFAASTLDGSIVVTGGTTDNKATCIFSLETKTWSRGPDLVQGRYAHAMARINQTLYAVAGRRGDEYLSSIEELDPANHAWATSGSLKVASFSCGAAAIDHTIVVVGGKTNEGLKPVQTFDTISKAAVVLETRPMFDPVRARGVAVPDGAVFVCQDGDLITVKRSAEGTLTVDHTQLVGFDERGLFGLLVDSRVRVFGGGKDVESSSTLAQFTLDGRKEEGNAAPLPVPLRVFGVFRWKDHALENTGN